MVTASMITARFILAVLSATALLLPVSCNHIFSDAAYASAAVSSLRGRREATAVQNSESRSTSTGPRSHSPAHSGVHGAPASSARLLQRSIGGFAAQAVTAAAATGSTVAAAARPVQAGAPAIKVVDGPYLQSLGQSSVLVVWRTANASVGVVRVGTSPTSLTLEFSTAAATTDPVVKVSGLKSRTSYCYSVGSPDATSMPADTSTCFRTLPSLGRNTVLRAVLLGDPGTGSSVQTKVLSALQKHVASTKVQPNFWMLLGDNAYDDGTDKEYSRYVFQVYQEQLKGVPMYAVIGNHDDSSKLTSAGVGVGPYFSRFITPQKGEGGGVASGSGAYYSFDYGTVHFVCLDSFLNSNTPTSPMVTWLQKDLAALKKSSSGTQWLIAIWHHPPYTKGTVDSDTGREMVAMRENVLPLLEAGGLDLVVGGHSHNYERSQFLNGHYGKSSSFDESMVVAYGSGTPADPFLKLSGLVANGGMVSVVAGSSGKVDSAAAGLMHPANVMFGSKAGLLTGGTFLVDVDGSELTGSFVSATGSVDDVFVIRKVSQLPTPSPSASYYPSRTSTLTVSLSSSTSLTASPSKSISMTRTSKPSPSESAGGSALFLQRSQRLSTTTLVGIVVGSLAALGVLGVCGAGAVMRQRQRRSGGGAGTGGSPAAAGRSQSSLMWDSEQGAASGSASNQQRRSGAGARAKPYGSEDGAGRGGRGRSRLPADTSVGAFHSVDNTTELDSLSHHRDHQRDDATHYVGGVGAAVDSETWQRAASYPAQLPDSLARTPRYRGKARVSPRAAFVSKLRDLRASQGHTAAYAAALPHGTGSGENDVTVVHHPNSSWTSPQLRVPVPAFAATGRGLSHSVPVRDPDPTPAHAVRSTKTKVRLKHRTKNAEAPASGRFEDLVFDDHPDALAPATASAGSPFERPRASQGMKVRTRASVGMKVKLSGPSRAKLRVPT